LVEHLKDVSQKLQLRAGDTPILISGHVATDKLTLSLKPLFETVGMLDDFPNFDAFLYKQQYKSNLQGSDDGV
jgi:hypothetical protein